MSIPLKKNFGYINSNSFDEESGWIIEGGEEAYYKALDLYQHEKYNDIIKVGFSGTFEDFLEYEKTYGITEHIIKPIQDINTNTDEIF